AHASPLKINLDGFCLAEAVASHTAVPTNTSPRRLSWIAPPCTCRSACRRYAMPHRFNCSAARRSGNTTSVGPVPAQPFYELTSGGVLRVDVNCTVAGADNRLTITMVCQFALLLAT